MKRADVVFCIVVIVVATSLCLGQTDYEPASQMVNGHRWATVTRMSITLFGIPTDAGGYTRDERAEIIANERLDPLLGSGVLSNPNNITVGRMNNEVTILCKNPKNGGGLPNPTLILTIDSNFSRYLKKNKWDIAYYWRDLLRKWSAAGVIKAVGPKDTLTDPAGRPLDETNSWHKVPKGYGQQYIPEQGGADQDSGQSQQGSGRSDWGVPGE